MEGKLAHSLQPILHFVSGNYNWAYIFCDLFQKEAPHWEVVCSRDYETAKTRLGSSVIPRVLITDQYVPSDDGLQLTEWIKGRPELQTVPVFVLADPQKQIQPEGCSKGVENFIKKPSSLTELRNAIRHILEQCESPGEQSTVSV